MDEIESIEITNAAIQYPSRWKPWINVLYIDTPQLLSFDIFERHGIRPWGIKIADNEQLPYVGIICKINKKRDIVFSIAWLNCGN